MDDIFRRFFGFGHGSRYNPSRPEGRDDFIDSRGIHNDQDDFINSNFFEPRGGSMDDMFKHFQQDIFLQMESLHRQMEDIFKGHGAMDFPSADFSIHPVMPNDQETEGSDNKIFTWSGPSPFFGKGANLPKKSPRDHMLKEDKETPFPFKDGPNLSTPRFGSGKKEDSDLDGKLSDDNILALIKRPEEKENNMNVQSPQSRPGNFFSSHTVRISTINAPDGKVEHKRVVRDSSGREESTVTRSIGDKSYSVTTVTDNTGAEEKYEKLQNMDEGELRKFEELWSKPRLEKPSSSPADSMLINPRTPAGNSVCPNDLGLFYRLFGGGKS